MRSNSFIGITWWRPTSRSLMARQNSPRNLFSYSFSSREYSSRNFYFNLCCCGLQTFAQLRSYKTNYRTLRASRHTLDLITSPTLTRYIVILIVTTTTCLTLRTSWVKRKSGRVKVPTKTKHLMVLVRRGEGFPSIHILTIITNQNVISKTLEPQSWTKFSRSSSNQLRLMKREMS